MFFDMFIKNPIEFTTKSKFLYFESVINSTHLSNVTKQHFLSEFSYSQRNYWTLSKFFHKYKTRGKCFCGVS